MEFWILVSLSYSVLIAFFPWLNIITIKWNCLIKDILTRLIPINIQNLEIYWDAPYVILQMTKRYLYLFHPFVLYVLQYGMVNQYYNTSTLIWSHLQKYVCIDKELPVWLNHKSLHVTNFIVQSWKICLRSCGTGTCLLHKPWCHVRYVHEMVRLPRLKSNFEMTFTPKG